MTLTNFEQATILACYRLMQSGKRINVTDELIKAHGGPEKMAEWLLANVPRQSKKKINGGVDGLLDDSPDELIIPGTEMYFPDYIHIAGLLIPVDEAEVGELETYAKAKGRRGARIVVDADRILATVKKLLEANGEDKKMTVADAKAAYEQAGEQAEHENPSE